MKPFLKDCKLWGKEEERKLPLDDISLILFHTKKNFNTFYWDSFHIQTLDKKIRFNLINKNDCLI